MEKLKKIELVHSEKLGRPGITYSDVSKAIEYLIKNKQEPTLKKLKQVLGHGGVTTISQYRAKYYAEHKKNKSRSIDYLNGWRDAMKSMRVYTQDNMK